MRIYTEVIFEWNDKQGKLVETSSESFDYSGEMALCGEWKAPTNLGFDDFGYEWQVRGYKSQGDWTDWVVSKRKPGGEWEQTLDSNYSYGNKQGMLNAAIASIPNSRSGTGHMGMHASADESKQYWRDTFHVDRPADASESQLQEQFDRYTGGEWIYGQGAWREISTLGDDWTELIDQDTGEGTGEWMFIGSEEFRAEFMEIKNLFDQGEYDEKYDFNNDGVIGLDDLNTFRESTVGGTDPVGLRSTEIAKGTAEEAIKGFIENWEAHLAPGDFDQVEQDVDTYISGLKDKEMAVTTAYEDIFGEEGTIFDIEETWEIAKEEGEEKYTTDIGTYETERTEGLEETVVGREGEFETLREEAGGEIRAAEAKIGAAGFAATGVGRTARDMLAEEIGKEARDIDEGFTEERSDVKQSYLKKVDPLEKEFGTGGTAYKDYERTRDLAAKGELSAWKTASETYIEAKRKYEEDYLPTLSQKRGGLDVALTGIGSQIAGAIETVRIGDPSLDIIADPKWDPFAEGGYLEAQFSGKDYGFGTFGIDPDLMMFTGVSDEYMGALETEFYTPYEDIVDPGLQLYDPNRAMPWNTTSPYGPPDLTEDTTLG